MPSHAKKTPATTGRKKVTASARAKTSIKKPRKVSMVGQDGSYIQDPVSTVTHTVTSSSPRIPSTSTNDAILTILQDMQQTNKDIVQRIVTLERKQSICPTSLASTSNSQVQVHTDRMGSRGSTGKQSNMSHTRDGDLVLNQIRSHSIAGLGVRPHVNIQESHQLTNSPLKQLTPVPDQNPHHDSIIPNIDTLRQNPTISQAVSQLLATYETQAKAEASQGKASNKRSGRYNTTDTSHTSPERRWANEGYFGSQGKKRQAYDDLTLTQWVVGQLSNVYQIKDPNVSKQALLQVILAMKDATSLPWQAVRGAWATSMHEVEEGRLAWGDATQWALNRLSASQIAMANANLTSSSGNQQLQHKKLCKYFNEGSCTYESNHGNYRHNCSYCSRQGRQAAHPEVKCNFKSRSQDKLDNK